MSIKHELTGPTKQIHSIAISNNNEFVACASADNLIYVWNILFRKPKLVCVLNGHTDAVTYVAFLKCNTHIISCSNDNTWRIWDIEHNTQRQIMCINDTQVVFTISRDKTYVALGGLSGICVVTNIYTAETVCIENNKGSVIAIAISNNNKHIAVCALNLDTIFTTIYCTKSGKQLYCINEKIGHDRVYGWKCNIRFSTYGNHLIMCCGATYIKVWDFKNGKTSTTTIGVNNNNNIISSVMSRNSKTLFINTYNDIIYQYEYKTMTILCMIRNFSDDICPLAVSPNGKYLLCTGTQNTVCIRQI